MRERTAKACGPGALVAGANPWGHEPRGDGDTKAGLAGARTIYAVSTIAQGMSMFRLHLRPLHSCAFYTCTRGCGCSETPGIPCALCFSLGVRCKTRTDHVAGLRTCASFRPASPRGFAGPLLPFDLRMAAPRVARKGEA